MTSFSPQLLLRLRASPSDLQAATIQVLKAVTNGTHAEACPIQAEPRQPARNVYRYNISPGEEETVVYIKPTEGAESCRPQVRENSGSLS